MKDKRKKKDRTWAEAARLVRTAPRPPARAGPRRRRRPLPARAAASSPGSRSLLFCGSGLARGPPCVCECVCACVRARAEGHSDYLGEPGARRARDRPGHFSGYFALGARPCLLRRGIPERPAALRFALPLRRPLCGNYHSLPAPPPPGIPSITLRARAVWVSTFVSAYISHVHARRVSDPDLWGVLPVGSVVAPLCAVSCALCMHTDTCRFCVAQVRWCL